MTDEQPNAAKPTRDVDGNLLCSYCGRPAVLHETSGHLYRQDYGPVWQCSPCRAWVGCHDGTVSPLGRLAGADLRQAKVEAHAAFDPLWQRKIAAEGCSKKRARAAGYKWLADQLGIEVAVCHIGMMNTAMCRRVVEVCAPYGRGQTSRLNSAVKSLHTEASP